jgi:hypothetical protein
MFGLLDRAWAQIVARSSAGRRGNGWKVQSLEVYVLVWICAMTSEEQLIQRSI